MFLEYFKKVINTNEQGNEKKLYKQDRNEP